MGTAAASGDRARGAVGAARAPSRGWRRARPRTRRTSCSSSGAPATRAAGCGSAHACPRAGRRPGWLARSALGGYEEVHTRLIVDRARLTLTLLRNGRAVFRAPVGIGRAATPTPAGAFYVRDRLRRYASPFYGPVAFGTSAQSATLTDWPAGGYVGIHGTNQPGLVPGRISHGCIRLRNADILRLARLLPVGTPLEIR